MAWTNSGWRSQSTVAAQITMGNAFLKELLDYMNSADISAAGYGRNFSTLERLYEREEKALNQIRAVGPSGGGIALASFPRRR